MIRWGYVVSVCIHSQCPPWKWQSGSFCHVLQAHIPGGSQMRKECFREFRMRKAMLVLSQCLHSKKETKTKKYIYYNKVLDYDALHLCTRHTTLAAAALSPVPSLATLRTHHIMSHGLVRDGWRLWMIAVCFLLFRCLIRTLRGQEGFAVMSIQWQMVRTKPVRIVQLKNNSHHLSVFTDFQAQ